MAMGFSGSNGGIGEKFKNIKHTEVLNMCKNNFHQSNRCPSEISYFINNSCNLSCKHCYVGYLNKTGALSTEQWIKAFDQFISFGGKIFGNVGKEPLLDWIKTRELLEYFKSKKKIYSDLLFGFVTNGLLLDKQKILDLDKILPDYIDISLDGNKKHHDFIRGKGTFEILKKNLLQLSHYELSKKIFISFTLNSININSIKNMIEFIYSLGFKNILISPYVTLNKKDDLYISDDKIITMVQRILKGEIINFSEYKKLNIYFKNDFTTTKMLMDKMVSFNIINTNDLKVDDYGVIFNKYKFGENFIYFNYIPFDTSLKTSIRISHNGYISNCLDMFYDNYQERAIANILDIRIRDIFKGDRFNLPLAV